LRQIITLGILKWNMHERERERERDFQTVYILKQMHIWVLNLNRLQHEIIKCNTDGEEK